MTETFQNLGLKKETIIALTTMSYDTPTDVQQEIIPRIVAKRNVVFTSRTGSGKTVGFSAGFFSRINPKQNIQMLIIVPTRELCLQIGTELKRFGDIMGFNVGMFYGGHDLIVDKKILSRRLQVVVATPGRLIQHINSKVIKVGDVSALIFDESDQMFDNGFYDDCVYIRSRVSSTAQVVLASATITEKVDLFVQKAIVDYDLVSVGELIPANIIQDILFCDISEKNDLLVKFFQGEKFKRAIVFVNTKIKVAAVHKFLTANNISAGLLSSSLEQKNREKCMRELKDAKFSVLVSTDVAARGLDIKDVDIIVNYDVPPRTEFYVHRIGRTGRQGEEGYAMTFVCPEDEEKFVVMAETFHLAFSIVNHDFELVEEDEE